MLCPISISDRIMAREINAVTDRIVNDAPVDAYEGTCRVAAKLTVMRSQKSVKIEPIDYNYLNKKKSRIRHFAVLRFT